MRGFVVAATLTSALTLAGCTAPGGSEGGTDGGSGQAQATQGGSGPGATGTPGVESMEKGDIVATQEVTLPGDRGTATVEIEALRVDGQVQTLTMFVTPHLTDTSGSLSLFHFLDMHGFRPRLVDKANLKEYTTLEKGAEAWSSDSTATEAGDGETFKAWAVLAAPEDGATSFDVTISDAYPRFTDIPVIS
ncbi:hypothetical protein [Pseudoclavibacter sp. RFBB5]|uniref:hypothetical protein n=1 Tax=Pseudoclavibacter sp. RFBB5 TaxID=2080574 RepID=UPI000CE8FCC8|nr:hypothetical protein [Pseudoclavibacter sp. RFBB5]PPG27608.1 hypothetical protein C5B97_15660 [Pseudoclavibacter sp. RFBB5]